MLQKVSALILLYCVVQGSSLECYICGDNGVCNDSNQPELKTCPGKENTCVIGVVKDETSEKVYDLKKCLEAEVAATGCIRIDEPNFDEKLCMCTKNGCNEKRCDDYLNCECAFADPKECYTPTKPDDPNAVSCRVCKEGLCGENEEGELTLCKKGETSCFYGKTTLEFSEINKTSIVTKGCHSPGVAIRGCVHAEEIVHDSIKHEHGFKGEYCYCDSNDCNKEPCDATQCSCAFSNPDDCNSANGIYFSVTALLASVMMHKLV